MFLNEYKTLLTNMANTFAELPFNFCTFENWLSNALDGRMYARQKDKHEHLPAVLNIQYDLFHLLASPVVLRFADTVSSDRYCRFNILYSFGEITSLSARSADVI